MVAVHSLARIPPRLTDLRHTFAARWPSPSSRVAWQSLHLSSSPTPLALQSHSHSLWRPTAPRTVLFQ